MIKLEALSGVVIFALWVFCLVDAIGAPVTRVRNLPKVAWIVIVLLFPLVGSIAWLAVGRPEGPAGPSPYDRAQPSYPEYDRPGRMAASNPDDDEAFLRQVRERAEQQRRDYEAKRKQQE